MGAIKMSMGYVNPVIELPCAFIDHYMATCPPVYALIYVYSLRQCFGGQSSVSSQAIAGAFNILETDVHNAWRHWEERGLIRLDQSGESIGITFLPAEAPKERPPAETNEADGNAPGEMAAVKKFFPASRPQYTPEELLIYSQQSNEIAQLFSLAEQTLGKPLTHNDMNLLFGFYDWLRLPVDVIGYMLSHCATNDRRDMRYIEKVAYDWADKQIDDMDKALDYVQTFNRDYRVILNLMGQNTGYPTPTQRKYISKWLNEFGMSHELVLHACDMAAVQIGKPKITYVDKMLTRWHKSGVTSPAEADALPHERSQAAQPGAAAKGKPAKPNRYANFTQREYDFAKIEKMEREYLLKKLEARA